MLMKSFWASVIGVSDDDTKIETDRPRVQTLQQSLGTTIPGKRLRWLLGRRSKFNLESHNGLLALHLIDVNILFNPNGYDVCTFLCLHYHFRFRKRDKVTYGISQDVLFKRSVDCIKTWHIPAHPNQITTPKLYVSVNIYFSFIYYLFSVDGSTHISDVSKEVNSFDGFHT